MVKIKQYLPLVCIILLSLLGGYFDIQSYLTLNALRAHQVVVEQYMLDYYAFSVLIFCLAYVAVVGLSIPGASFMTLMAGFLLGQWVGALCVIIAATMGASIIFISAKMASQEVLEAKAGPWVKRMQEGFQKDAFYYLLTLRLVPLFPFFIVNLVSAFFQISLRQFILATFFGIMPGTFVYVSIGVALREVIHQPNLSLEVVLEPKILIALCGFAILSMIPVIYNRLKS